MSLDKKKKKAEALGIDISKIEGEITEDTLDELIEQKQKAVAQDKEEKKIQAEAKKKADLDAKKTQLILKDIDGFDVDQEDYFFPDLVTGKKDTAPSYFNKICGYPVDREDLIEVFATFFPRKKGFLFYKARDKELYLIIVPLKYATTISKSNESLPGDFQRHAMSFIGEGSVNVDSLKLKLGRFAKHTSISTEPLA